MLAKIQEELRNCLSKDLPLQWMEVKSDKAIFALITDWVVIISALISCSLIKMWWILPIAFICIGCAQYALFILGHDAIHGSFLADRNANDRFSKWFVHGALFMGFEDGRRNHLEHHKLLGNLDDPDRYIHTFDEKQTVPRFTLFCLGLLTFAKTVLKVTPFGKMHQAASAQRLSANIVGTMLLDYIKGRIPVFVDQLFILTFMYGVLHLPFWSYPILWVAPIYFCVFVPDEIRAFCEHAVLVGSEDQADEHRLITYTPPLYERLYFSPHNMNFHAEHHLWPRIPHYNLPKAHNALQNQKGIWVRRSYLGFLSDAFGFLHNRQKVN